MADKRFDFDLIVLGSGAGGGVAAHQATALGKRVAIFEPAEIGGECPNWGCVPTKALLHVADIYRSINEASEYGISAMNIKLDYKTVKAYKDLVVSRTGVSEGEDLLEADGITVIREFARFIDSHTVTAGRKHYRSKNFLIATGTHPAIPPVPGLRDVPFMSHKEAVNLEKLPRSLFIIGGGPIGCEFAQLFNDFGVKVHVGEYQNYLAPNEDPEVGQLLQAIFEDRGVSVHTDSRITRIGRRGSKIAVHFIHQDKEHTALVDSLLVAAGMTPNTDLGLENAGVEYTKRGIVINHFMQTSAGHIYAAGDVVGPYQFTHTASYQSRLAAHNMYHRKRRKLASYRNVPRCIFTRPEIASTGLGEAQARAKGYELRIGTAPIELIGRANTANDFNGFVKILADNQDKIIGASIVAPRAGELIHELTLAIELGAHLSDIARTIHAFPTYSEAIKLAALSVE